MRLTLLLGKYRQGNLSLRHSVGVPETIVERVVLVLPTVTAIQSKPRDVENAWDTFASKWNETELSTKLCLGIIASTNSSDEKTRTVLYTGGFRKSNRFSIAEFCTC